MARTKQTARKSTGGLAPRKQLATSSWKRFNNPSWRNNNSNREPLPNRWNKIYKNHDDDPWSERNFGSMRRGASSKYSFQSQLQSEEEQNKNIHSKSIFNDINTLSSPSKSILTTTMNKGTFQAPKRRKTTGMPSKQQLLTTNISSFGSINMTDSDNGNNMNMALNIAPKRGYKSHSRMGGMGGYRRYNRFRSGTVAMREIRKYQKSTNLLMSKTAFGRLVREIGNEYKNELRFTKQALEAIQQVTEWYLVGLLKDANLCALHCRRMKIECKDIQIARRLRDKRELQYTF